MRPAFPGALLSVALGLAALPSPAAAAPALRPGMTEPDRMERRSRHVGDGFAERALRQGFMRVEAVERSRDGVELRAVRPTGEVVRMRFDPRTGRLIASQRIGWRGEAGLVPSRQLAGPVHGPAAGRYGPVR